MKICAIIPARYQSSRFPAKPLHCLLGKPMVVHVCERAATVFGREHVFVATDDARIATVVETFGFQFVMTPESCLTGTDRIAIAARLLPYDLFINIQGDEPAIEKSTIQAVLDAKARLPGKVVNAMAQLVPADDPRSPNLPKVVAAENGALLYMSRAVVPANKSCIVKREVIRKQVCVYAFERAHLDAFEKHGRKSAVEAEEDIEILRFLDLGISVHMVEVHAASVAVDCLEDVPKAEAAILGMKSGD